MKVTALLGLLIAISMSLTAASALFGGLKGEAVEEGTKFILRKFGVEVSKELGDDGAKLVARKLEVLATKYGEEEAVTAAKKIGPRIFRLVEEVGEDGAPKAIKLMSRAGDDAIWVVARKRSMAIFARFGDDAADAIIKHKEIAEGVIEQFGSPAARALKALEGQNARRLAMMTEDGQLTGLARHDELLEVIGRHGDRAMNWVWRNKGALATTAVLAKFLQDPQPFIDGTVQVADVGGEKLIKPVATELARGISTRTSWTLVISLMVIVLGGVLCTRGWLKHRRHVIWSHTEAKRLEASRKTVTGQGTAAMVAPLKSV